MKEQQSLSSSEKYYKNLQEKALKGDASEREIESLISEGQKTEFNPVLIDSRDKPDHVVAVIQDSMESTRVTDFSTSIVIVKGKCHHCGSNRLKSAHKEPMGVHCISCPVCNRDNMSSNYEFEYDLESDKNE